MLRAIFPSQTNSVALISVSLLHLAGLCFDSRTLTPIVPVHLLWKIPVDAFDDPNMSQESILTLKPRLEAATRKYQDLQEGLEKAVASRAKLEAQLLETENVKKVYIFFKFPRSRVAFELLE